jgi:6-pyruvoyltetrahydropterin/6-carboxytetrahydropterin synthase
MEAELIKTFTFDAAHCLPAAGDAHKCARVHGHGYRLDVHVTGQVDPATGWVMDFAALKELVEPVVAELDHRLLNDVPGLENSTSEMLAKFFWDRLEPVLAGLSAIAIWESDTSRCVYRGR